MSYSASSISALILPSSV